MESHKQKDVQIWNEVERQPFLPTRFDPPQRRSNTSGPPWNLSYTVLLVHVFNVHRGAATHLYSPHSIPYKFIQHMSIVESYDGPNWSKDKMVQSQLCTIDMC